jgi:hypothetical protein
LNDRALERVSDTRKFIDQVLVPYANAYEIATKASYRSRTPEAASTVRCDG